LTGAPRGGLLAIRPSPGREFRHALDREVGQPRQHRGQVLAHRQARPPGGGRPAPAGASLKRKIPGSLRDGRPSTQTAQTAKKTADCVSVVPGEVHRTGPPLRVSSSVRSSLSTETLLFILFSRQCGGHSATNGLFFYSLGGVSQEPSAAFTCHLRTPVELLKPTAEFVIMPQRSEE